MRFGRDKLLEPIDGVPLVARAVTALAEVADEIVVVTAPGWSLPPGMPAGVELRVVADDPPFEGPLAGVAQGLAVAQHEVVLVAGGDMPALVP
jgi:molybdopterin-guanine dinucleotide biosynthesis protein A